MKKDKKRIIGIVMLVIGVLGLFGVPSSDGKNMKFLPKSEKILRV